MPEYSASGIYLPITTTGEKAHAFVPDPLPPARSPTPTGEIQDLYEKANRALGRLDGISTLLPDTSLFIYFYVRKEAVLSSQIEGTQSSLSDLLLFEMEEMPGVPVNDVQEVSNYVAALQHGIERIRKDDFPISNRLIREMHARLLEKGRGSEKDPGDFRTSQNWIGGSRPGNAIYVPPPHDHIQELMGNLEKYIHDHFGRIPSLVKAGIAHVQFESIHPFQDGNGRLGRLLITLLLCAEEVLQDPVLYLSLFFKKNRDEYYRLLQNVRANSAWDQWLEFFLRGVYETAQQAFGSAKTILDLFDRDRQRIQGIGRLKGSALQVHEYLRRNAFLTVPDADAVLTISRPAIHRSVDALTDLGIVEEITGKQRNRVWFYKEYIRILNEGTEAA